jgi:cytochrome P450
MPGSVPLLGSLYTMRTDPLGSLTRTLRECGDRASVVFPGQKGFMFFHPDDVKALIVDNAKNVSKDTPGFAALKLLLGNGLVTSDGAFWLRQRRIAQPAFHRQKIYALGKRMVEYTERTAHEWSEAARMGRVVDVAESMMRLTLRIVGDTMLGADVDKEAADVGRNITLLLHELNQRIVRPWLPPLRIPTPANRRFVRAGESILTVIERAIADKRANPDSPGGDFLRMLIEARDEDTGEAMTDQQLRDEVGTIFAAGHETTANLLAWAFHWLSRVPDVRRKLVHELDTVLGDREVTAEDYPKLPYLRMVISETLRISPPVWIFSRRTTAPIELPGLTVPQGHLVFLSPYTTHRHPGFWENPEGFDPERFREGTHKDRPTLAYYPFGAGPRKCIGDTFALVEATLVLATLVRRFELELLPGSLPTPEPVITLRPQGGLRMRVRARVRTESSHAA